MAAHRTSRVVASGFEWRADSSELTAEGYASTFGQPYDMGWYTETVRTGAFTKTLSERPDVSFLINHEGMPLARTTAGSLDLSQDSHGLHVRAKFDPADPDAQRLAVKARAGLVDRMSFGFRTIQDSWSPDYAQRELVELSLQHGDVSAVTDPANPSTSFGMRSADPSRVRDLYAGLRELRVGAEFSQANRDKLMGVLEHLGAVNGNITEQGGHLDDMFHTLHGMLGISDGDIDPDEDSDDDDAQQGDGAQTAPGDSDADYGARRLVRPSEVLARLILATPLR